LSRQANFPSCLIAGLRHGHPCSSAALCLTAFDPDEPARDSSGARIPLGSRKYTAVDITVMTKVAKKRFLFPTVA
jgi:hypothetical protein